MDTYYAGNRSSFRHVETRKMSHSALVTSLNHPAISVLFRRLEFFLLSSAAFTGSVRAGSSLNVVRFTVELDGLTELRLCIAPCPVSSQWCEKARGIYKRKGGDGGGEAGWLRVRWISSRDDRRVLRRVGVADALAEPNRIPR